MEGKKRNPNYGSTIDSINVDQFQSTYQLVEENVSKKDQSSDTYNPFEHRNLAKPTSDAETFTHLIKGSIGSGILAMPLAFANGGLVFSFVFTIIVGIICTHCVQMLVDSSHKLCRRAKVPSLGFPETAEMAFTYGPPSLRSYAKAANVATKSSVAFSCIMGNTVYLVFISATLQQIVEHSNPDFKIDIRFYILMLYVPLLVVCLVKDLKHLVPFSVVANISIFVVFGITFYYMFFEGISDPGDLPKVAHYDKMPLFFSTVVFAMEGGIGLIMPIENAMKTPQHFTGCPGVLNLAMIVVVLLYAFFGFFGYIKFQDATEGTITINLLKQYGDEIPAQVAQYLVAVAIFFTYALLLYVPATIIWDEIKGYFKPDKHFVYHYVMRFILITGTVALAIAVPNLGPIISLVGAICFSVLPLLMPCVIDTVTRWEEGFGPLNWILWKNVLLSAISIFVLVSGTYASIIEIIEAY